MSISLQLNQAQRALADGKPDHALKILMPLVNQSPQGVQARIGIINALMKLDRYADAISHFNHALSALPGHPGLIRGKTVALNRQGIEALKAGDLERAQDHLNQALGLTPDSPEALYNLALVKIKQSQFEQALNLLEQLPDTNTSAEVALQRAKIARGQGDFAAAMDWLKQCTRRNPAADLLLSVGDECLALRDLSRARATYSQSLTMAQQAALDEGPAQLRLAALMIPQGEWEEPQRWLDTLRNHPDHSVEARTRLIDIHVRAGRLDQAQTLVHGLGLATVLKGSLEVPPVVDSTAHISTLRETVLTASKKLLADPTVAMKSLDELAWNNFYLTYQGHNNRQLKTQLGQFIQRQVHKLNPGLLEPAKTRPKAQPRIGLLSSRWGNNVVGHYFGSWISAFASQGWDTVVYQTPAQIDDEMTRELLTHGTRARTLSGSALSVVAAIKSDGLDVILMPEVGADIRLTPLAATRLATLQLAGWGLPDTTGLTTMDGFISVAAMEPEDGRHHYSEQLLMLPGLGTAYPRPPSSADLSRHDVGLPLDKTLYLLPHSHFKIHPDLDPLLAAIMVADTNGQLVMFEGHESHMWQRLSQRLDKIFTEYGLNLASRVIMLPALPRERYLAVNRCCDVLLDTLHFSGGNTSLDALSVGLPVVTIAGSFMRGRQTSAMLQMAGLPEMVAACPEDYVSLALALAGGQIERRHIEQAAQTLFDHQEPLQALVSQVSELWERQRL